MQQISKRICGSKQQKQQKQQQCSSSAEVDARIRAKLRAERRRTETAPPGQQPHGACSRVDTQLESQFLWAVFTSLKLHFFTQEPVQWSSTIPVVVCLGESRPSPLITHSWSLLFVSAPIHPAGGLRALAPYLIPFRTACTRVNHILLFTEPKPFQHPPESTW
jgi:hypothetical protein